jgi:hypothetical protein
MSPFDLLAERRIHDAQARGEFDDLPGSGRPLDLEDDLLVPEELRIAYRLLKNAGYVAPEPEMQREIRSIERLLERAVEGERTALVSRLTFLLSQGRGVRRSPRLGAGYEEKIGAWFASRRNGTRGST